MNLKRRYLRPIKFGKHSPDFYVFDTETGVIKNGEIQYMLSARPEHFIFGVVYGPNGFVKVIHTVKEFQTEFKKRRYKNKLVYAHNAEYDLSCLYGNIYLMDNNAIFNGKFISATNGNCKFADSYNLLPTSVKKIGEMLGLQKMELGKNLKSSVKNMVKDVEYCVRDCEIVYKALADLFSESEPSFTIGSLSLKIFRANFLPQGIKINPLSDLFFDALYGGRTEAFKIGEVKANVYDLKSAYPFAMVSENFCDPSRLRYAQTKQFESYLNDSNYEGMIEATVTIDEKHNIPMLPFRTTDKLLFPVGTFRGAWMLNEFRYAYYNFRITVHKVHKLIVSEAIESPFKVFIDFYFAKRSETTNVFKKYYYKLFMNNLYGKLIQRAREEYRFCTTVKEAKNFMKQRKIKNVELIDVNGGYFLKYDIDKIFSHTIACWGAQITACVRVKLHKGIMEHPEETVYVDTDSRMVEKELNLNDQHLGGWSKEKKVVTKIRALKDYVYMDFSEKKEGEEKFMLKGVKKDAKQLDSEANVFKFKRMIKTRESFRRIDNLPPGTFVEQIKVLTGDYKKRTVLKDGTTKPFKLKIKQLLQ